MSKIMNTLGGFGHHSSAQGWLAWECRDGLHQGEDRKYVV